MKKRIEGVLREKGYDTEAFQSALDTGKGKKRVEEDMALGNKLRVEATPTKVVTSDIIVGSVPDEVLERYVGE